MFERQRTGSVVCRSCGRLVGVSQSECPYCGARSPALWGFAPLIRRLGQDLGFTQIVIGACIVLYAATLLADPAGIRNTGFLSFLAPSGQSLFRFGASGFIPLFQEGRWWTLLSAGWLHGGALHILFNMLWVRQLAPPTADLYGAGRLVIIYTVSCAAGFALTSAAPLILDYLPGFLAFLLSKVMGGGAGITIGASAPIFGLLGALVHYGRRGGGSAFSQQIWSWAIILFLFGLLVPGIDNWAHLGGFLGGWLISYWLNPLKPERMNHLLGALLCLALTAAAIVASLLVGLPAG